MKDTKEPITAPVPDRIATTVTELDIHRLELRFEQIRVTRPGELSRLLQSIATDGLRLPIHVADTGDALILIDGYLRLGAYLLLKHDKIPAFCRPQPLNEALCEWFANQRSRTLEPIEEAWLIRHLMDEDLSRQAIAQQFGKGKSWISRRLALLDGLNDRAQQALRKGEMTSWAASRVFVPLARANRADAERLLDATNTDHFSTRELSLWYQHYQKSRGEKRRRLVEHPRLFLDALHNPQTKAPDGGLPLQWLNELRGVIRHINKLEQQIPDLLDPPPNQLLQSQMFSVGQQAREEVNQLMTTIASVATINRQQEVTQPDN